eukprot:233539-Amphidinium_carterae.3
MKAIPWQQQHTCGNCSKCQTQPQTTPLVCNKPEPSMSPYIKRAANRNAATYEQIATTSIAVILSM